MPEPEPTSSRIRVRDARIDEAGVIAALIQASYAQYEPEYTREGWQRYFGMLGDVESHFGRAEVIVAEREGVAVGCVMFYADGALSGQGQWPPGWAGILRLAVHPSHRSLGLGRLLRRSASGAAVTGGIGTLALHATAWMAVSRGMYERRASRVTSRSTSSRAQVNWRWGTGWTSML